MEEISAKWQALVLSFPALARANAPTDPLALDEWARNRALGSGALSAVQFVLNCYNNSHPWKVGKFDLFQAIRVWDNGQVAAFADWAKDPFQP